MVYFASSNCQSAVPDRQGYAARMTFKNADLLQKCGSKHMRLQEDQSVYLELWEALMRWLRSQMEKKQVTIRI